MASSPITSWQIEAEVETVTDFIFLGSKITADVDCGHEIKRYLLLGRKAVRNLSSVQSLSRVWLFATPWTVARQASLSITNSQSLLKLMSHRVSDAIQLSHPLSSPSPPAFNLSHHQGSYQMSQFFASGGQSIGVSASVLLMNIQDWFPLELTGWISLQSKGLSRVFPTPQFKSINSLVLSFLYSPTLTSIHDYWTNHSFTRWTFVGKVMSLLFNMLSRSVIAFLQGASVF